MPDQLQDDLTKQIMQRQAINGAVSGQPAPPQGPMASSLGNFSFHQPTVDIQSLIEALKKSGMTGSRTTDIDLDTPAPVSFEELMKRASAISAK